MKLKDICAFRVPSDTIELKREISSLKQELALYKKLYADAMAQVERLIDHNTNLANAHFYTASANIGDSNVGDYVDAEAMKQVLGNTYDCN